MTTSDITSTLHYIGSTGIRSTVYRQKDGTWLEARRNDITWTRKFRADHPDVKQRVFPTLEDWHAILPLDDPLVIAWHKVRGSLPAADPSEPVCKLSPHLAQFMGSPVATGSQFVFALRDFTDRYKKSAHDYVTFFLTWMSVEGATKSYTSRSGCGNTYIIQPDPVHYLRQSGHILSVTPDVRPSVTTIVAPPVASIPVSPSPSPTVVAIPVEVPKPAGCSATSENQKQLLSVRIYLTQLSSVIGKSDFQLGIYLKACLAEHTLSIIKESEALRKTVLQTIEFYKQQTWVTRENRNAIEKILQMFAPDSKKSTEELIRASLSIPADVKLEIDEVDVSEFAGEEDDDESEYEEEDDESEYEEEDDSDDSDYVPSESDDSDSDSDSDSDYSESDESEPAPKDGRKLVDETLAYVKRWQKEKETPVVTNLQKVADQILTDVQNTAYGPQFKQILAKQFIDLCCLETTYRALHADDYQRIRFRTVLLMLVDEPVMTPLRAEIGEILRKLA